MRLIIDTLTENKGLNYEYTGAVTIMDPNLISMDFVVKKGAVRGEVNVRGLIDVPLDLQGVSNERIRVNKKAVSSLLARVYLYQKDYDRAYVESSKVIADKRYELVPIDEVFLSNSKEAIWQLQPVASGVNSVDALVYFLPLSGPDGVNYPVYLSSDLMGAFEASDQRKAYWTNTRTINVNGIIYNYPFATKYKISDPTANVTEFEMVLRLAEQYLIRAEAAANGAGGGLSSSKSDLDSIRKRAGLPNYSGLITKDALLAEIMKQRRLELFSEWGNRWFDLKRTETINDVMPNVSRSKGGTWETTDKLYPIPVSEILLNRNLTQNPGY